MPESAVKVVEWERFARIFARNHRQGEHVSIVGQTGSGKTVLGLNLCKIVGARKGQDGRPSRVVVLGTKPRDDTLSSLGWPVIKKWPPAYGQEHAVVWPRVQKDPSTRARQQRAVFRPLLNAIYAEGGQTVFIDEASDFERSLPEGMGLSSTMEQYWGGARSLKLTLIAGTQRPRHVTRSMWAEPSWLFIFAPDDDDDLRRVAEMSGARTQVMDIAQELGAHEFLCIRRKRSEDLKKLYVSRVA
jgi:energy-coupling factor transporter ATP-binding protein EcfA2